MYQAIIGYGILAVMMLMILKKKGNCSILFCYASCHWRGLMRIWSKRHLRIC